MWNSCTGLFATRGPDRPLERAGAFAAEEAEPTARVRELVEAARVAAAPRWQPHGIHTGTVTLVSVGALEGSVG